MINMANKILVKLDFIILTVFFCFFIVYFYQSDYFSKQEKELSVRSMSYPLIDRQDSIIYRSKEHLKVLDDNQNSRIIGGEDALEGEYPFMMALERFNGETFIQSCGGTVVAPNWVLTAAHCFATNLGEINLSDYRGVTGAVDLTNVSNAQIHEFKSVRIYPRYTTEFFGDIALLELAEPTAVTPIGLAGNSVEQNLQESELLTVIGWGVLTEGGNEFPPLQKLEVPLRTNQQCLAAYEGDAEISENLAFCAGFFEGGQDGCSGDSGGPLFATVGQSIVQFGVVSRGRGCARPESYGIYANIGVLENWLRANMQGVHTKNNPVGHFLERDFNNFLLLNQEKQTFSTIVNNSAEPVMIENALIQGNDANVFSVNDVDCFNRVLGQGEECTVNIVARSSVSRLVEAIIVPIVADGIAPSAEGYFSYLTVQNINAELALGTEDDMSWYSGGDNIWTTVQDPDGVRGNVLKSGDIIDNQATGLVTTLVGPTTVEFDYRVSSEANYDNLLVIVDGEVLHTFSGTVAWSTASIDIPVGETVLSFHFSKDGIDEEETLNSVWLNNVRIEKVDAGFFSSYYLFVFILFGLIRYPFYFKWRC